MHKTETHNTESLSVFLISFIFVVKHLVGRVFDQLLAAQLYSTLVKSVNEIETVTNIACTSSDKVLGEVL